jgi:predicted RNA-binding protein with RPS1 domain
VCFSSLDLPIDDSVEYNALVHGIRSEGIWVNFSNGESGLVPSSSISLMPFEEINDLCEVR